MSRPVQLLAVPPAMAPGALWRRVTTAERLVVAGPLADDSAVTAMADQWLASHLARLTRGTVWIHIYDGDDGRCIATIVVGPDDTPPEAP